MTLVIVFIVDTFYVTGPPLQHSDNYIFILNQMNPEHLTSTKQIMNLCFNKVNHFLEIHLVDLYVFILCTVCAIDCT